MKYIILSTFFAISGCSQFPIKADPANMRTEARGAASEENDCTSSLLAGPECFRFGNEWTKIELQNENDLSNVPEILRPALRGTSQFMGGASGVLLGKFQDKWVMATAAHLCTRNFGGPCPLFPLNGRLRFLGVSFKAQDIVGFWLGVDLMLFTVQFSEADEAKLSQIEVGQNFDFSNRLNSGSLLAVGGYTLIHGMSGNLQMTADSDCKILSQTSEVKMIKDPDTFHPDSQAKWAFAMGCDVAPGDSGGPVLDRKTGLLLGLVWTGKTPTGDVVKVSDNLEKMRTENDSKIWSELAYSSPAPKIAETLRLALQNTETGSENKAILKSILAQ